MRDIVELSNDVMPMIWSSEAIRIVSLRTKVTQDDDSRLVGPVEQRANKKFKVVHTPLVTGEGHVRNGCIVQASVPHHLRWIIDVKFQYHEVGVLGHMMCTTETKVSRIRPTHGPIGELGSRMWEHAQPPPEEKGRITQRGQWVVTSTMTCRH